MKLQPTFPPNDQADELILRNLSESDWQAVIQQYWAELGWRYQHHEYDSRRSRFHRRSNLPAGMIETSGWPDLIMLRPPRLVFIECKAEGGKLSRQQSTLLHALTESNIENYVWSPSDWRHMIAAAQ